MQEYTIVQEVAEEMVPGMYAIYATPVSWDSNFAPAHTPYTLFHGFLCVRWLKERPGT